MWRKIMDDLVSWKNNPDRKPLVIRGVRQCGKTTILKRFGEERYRNCVYVNLEKQPAFCAVFEKDHDVQRIVSDISALSRTKIEKEDTLLILDEIQSCPRALASLKYFQEDGKGYHVACAGSLLGIVLARSSSKPVGKTEDLTMYPMDFHEWMIANGEDLLWEAVSENPGTLDAALADRLERLYREYLFVGGMPEAVKSWVTTHDEEEVSKAHDGILNWYSADMLGHAPNDDSDKIFQVWTSIPSQLFTETGNFIFSHVRKGGRARELEGALQWLVDAGLVHKVYKVETPKVPMKQQMDLISFKAYLCDVGLLGRMMNLTLDAYLYPELGLLSDDYRGGLTENFVLNEIIHLFGEDVCFWRSGREELDFLIQHRSRIVPVEVKSGRKVRASSLGKYINEYDPVAAAVVSMNPPRIARVMHVPLYMIWSMRKLLNDRIDEVTG